MARVFVFCHHFSRFRMKVSMHYFQDFRFWYQTYWLKSQIEILKFEIAKSSHLSSCVYALHVPNVIRFCLFVVLTSRSSIFLSNDDVTTADEGLMLMLIWFGPNTEHICTKPKNLLFLICTCMTTSKCFKLFICKN